MKHRILLEQLIRKALHEQGATIVVETAVLNTEEDKLMKDLHKEILGSTQLSKVTYSTADGTAILISRRGGRGDDKKFEMNDAELKKQAIFKLNTLQAGLLAKTSSDYVWILDMQDTKLGKRKKPKEERLFATYRFCAFYISRSLLTKFITASAAGYIESIGKGALLFDRAKIKTSEWKSTKGTVSIDEPDKIGGVLTVPRSELKFGDSESSVLSLFRYFYSDTTASSQLTNLVSVKNSRKFGCELRAACEQFQKEQGLTITGEWDSDSISKAEALYQANINKLDPAKTPGASYVFQTPTDLKTRIATCELENTVITPVGTDLRYTNDEIIKATSTSTYSDVTKYFQNYLVNVIKNKTTSPIQTALNGNGQYFTKVANDIDGYWGKNSKGLTTNYKKLTKLSPANGTVTSEFIKSLKDLNSQGATVKSESRILSNKIILEQVTFDLTVDTETPSNDNVKNTKVIKKSTDTDKDTQPKDKDKETAYDKADQQSTVAKTKWKLISNAIKFMQGIGNLNQGVFGGYNVEDSIRVINKYIVIDNPTYMSQRAAYIDMIMRLLYGDLQSVAKKFPKQFNYFITRNRSSATSVDYLRNIRPSTLPYTGLTNLLWGNGRKLGLDEDDARGLRRSLSLIYSPKFAFLSGVTPKLKLRYNKKQVEDRILYAYDNKIWGDPDGKRINVPKPKPKK